MLVQEVRHMEQYSQVLEVQIKHDGTAHRASYFVEEGTIHARIGERMMTVPLGPRPAADSVKTMLSGYLAQQSRKLRRVVQFSK
jgi:hypothetical protein